jgi:hypothetical protein
MYTYLLYLNCESKSKMEPTLSYLRQTRLDGTQNYEQLVCSTCNQKTFVDY